MAEKKTKDLSELIKKHSSQVKTYKRGELVKGTVVSIDNRYVLIDVGAKSEGLIPTDELKFLPDGGKDIDIGSEITAVVIQSENRQGNLVFSLKKAESDIAWSTLLDLYSKEEPIEVEILDYIKGGLMVNVSGQKGFIPISHLNREHFEEFNTAMAAGKGTEEADTLGGLKGSKIKVKIIEINPDKNRLILSEKEVMSQADIKKKEERLASIQVGDVEKGTVSTVLPYGILVDLGGVDGLVHISEIAWEKVSSPSDYFKPGDEIEVKVISKEDDKIALSVKELKDNPWDNVETKYPIGKIVESKVSKVVPFGAFIELEPGLDGLIHISETNGPLQVGDKVKAIVVKVSSKDRKLALSIRQLGDIKIYK